MAGKRVGLLPGTYILPAVTSSNTAAITMMNGGPSAGQPTYIASTIPQAAILTQWNGSAYVQSTFRGGDIALRADNFYIYGIQFNNYNSGAAITTWGSNHTIDTCGFQNINVGSIFCATSTACSEGGDNCGAITGGQGAGTPNFVNLLVTNCYFNNVTSSFPQSAGYANNFNCNAVDLFQHTNTTIQYCECVHVYSLYFLKGACGPYTIQNNYVHDCAAFARAPINAFPEYCSPIVTGARSTIRNNICYNVLSIATGSAGNPGQVDCDLYNNTFCYTATSGDALKIFTYHDATTYLPLPHGTPGTTCTFYNNILYPQNSKSSGTTYQFTANGIDLTTPFGRPYNQIMSLMNYNCHTNKNGGYFVAQDTFNAGQTWSSLSAWRAGTGFDANSIQADPALAQLAGPTGPASFRLRGTNGTGGSSPCVGSGRTGGASSGSIVNIGAWDGVVTQIGINWSPPSLPSPPFLRVS
jgi:hypothetical protein